MYLDGIETVMGNLLGCVCSGVLDYSKGREVPQGDSERRLFFDRAYEEVCADQCQYNREVILSIKEVVREVWESEL